jgi:hypothetical protein
MSSTQQLLLGEGAGGSAPVFIEDVFSTYLYTGTGTGVTQRIAPGLDMSTKGGMVWVKNRTEVTDHEIYDTARGERKYIRSNTTDAEFDSGANSVQYKTSGWDAYAYVNEVSKVMASWTFRKQPKFFDVVTYTGNGVAGLTVSHNLGSVPGCIIVKSTTSVIDWAVFHTSLGPTKVLNLNLSGAAGTSSLFWNDTAPTSTNFTVGDSGRVNGAGQTYVAYIFAHDAGGFGLLGTDNVISCGQFATDGAGNATVNLGYEPQWAIVKRIDAGGTWWMMDTMRGWTASTGNNFQYLQAQFGGAEGAAGTVPVNATGFTVAGGNFVTSATYIYIAIRRGPMKTPTDPTKVFAMATAVGTEPSFVSNAVVDMGFNVPKNSGALFFNQSRLMGAFYLNANATTAQVVESSRVWDYMNGMLDGQSPNTDNVGYMFGRAPGFFDVACYTGNGATQNISHNLGVAPELMIVKKRSSGSTSNWAVYAAPLANADAYLFINTSDAVASTSVLWNSTAPTNTVFSLGGSTNINESGQTCVAYLFATLAGISKVGSYTGNGTTQTINCGFPSGVRWVMIKRTDTTGDWYVYDTLRGMTVLTDPYLRINVAAAEVATLGSVTTVATGFALNSAVLAAINVSAGNYIFLAIA